LHDVQRIFDRQEEINQAGSAVVGKSDALLPKRRKEEEMTTKVFREQNVNRKFSQKHKIKLF